MNALPLITREARSFLNNAALFSAQKSTYDKGDFFKVDMPFTNIYLVNDPSILQHILVDNEAKYEKSKVYWKELRAVIGKAMGSIEGDEWTSLKQLQKVFFTKSFVIQQYYDDVQYLSQTGVNHIPQDRHIDLLSTLSNINLSIVLKTVFGVSDQANEHLVSQMIADGEAYILWRSKMPWRKYYAFMNGASWRARHALRYLQTWTDGILSTHNYEDSKMIAALRDAGYDNRHIRNELIVHLGASTETVAVTESWTLYLLTTHPEYFTLVQNEVANNAYLSSYNEETYPLLTAAIKEAMRLYPPSHAIVRDCIADEGDNIFETVINKGDVLYISAYGIHRNPRLWDKANTYYPQRFWEGNEDLIPKYAYLPFGAGKHTCIGRYLALPMMITTLAQMIERYDIAFTDDEVKIPVSLSTLKSHNGFQAIIKSKNKT